MKFKVAMIHLGLKVKEYVNKDGEKKVSNNVQLMDADTNEIFECYAKDEQLLKAVAAIGKFQEVVAQFDVTTFNGQMRVQLLAITPRAGGLASAGGGK